MSFTQYLNMGQTDISVTEDTTISINYNWYHSQSRHWGITGS